MFSYGEFELIKATLDEHLYARRNKLKKIWGILLIIVVCICVCFILLFPKQFHNGETAWILPVYGGIAFLVTFIGYIVSISYKSEKPFFTYLYNEIIQKINNNEGLFLHYSAYPKLSKEFNEKGGLFTKYASIKTRRHITGKSELEHYFEIMDCTLTTSNGKNQTVHFDGVYYSLQKNTNTILQVRTSGSPKKKGQKYYKSDEFDNIKVYKLENENLSNIDYMYINFIRKLQENLMYKKLYLSVVEDGIHLAYSYKKHPLRKQKVFTLESLNKNANDVFEELSIINELEAIDTYDY